MERLVQRLITVDGIHHTLLLITCLEKVNDMLRTPHKRYADAATFRVGLRRFLARTDQVTRAHGLTAERYELLLLIKTARDGDATVSRLAQQLHIGQSAATQLARRVEDAGLIERTVSSRDARVHPLWLTAEGERRLAAVVGELTGERKALARALDEL
jgi:DNA-binding MarR family transcriptional regulator